MVASMVCVTMIRGFPATHGWVNGEDGQHALLVPPWEESDLCSPTWARRRRGRFRDPVTLVMALEVEPVAYHADMVAEHLHCLTGQVAAANGLLAMTPLDDPGRVVPGMNLLVFAAELASAIRPDEFADDLEPEARAGCAETVAAAALAAAGLLSGAITAVQAALVAAG